MKGCDISMWRCFNMGFCDLVLNGGSRMVRKIWLEMMGGLEMNWVRLGCREMKFFRGRVGKVIDRFLDFVEVCLIVVKN